MPLENRVDPRATIFRSSARGPMMGNRGPAIHNERREIVRPFHGRRWITCILEFQGRRRTVMSPGLYTELFFLDEAVAFAAGHRPCAECRRARFNEFRSVWLGQWSATGKENCLRPRWMPHSTRQESISKAGRPADGFHVFRQRLDPS